MAEYDLIASAAFGMEAIVVRELRDLGYPDATVSDGRVFFKGDAAAICRANLWLRCAERVQVVVGDFAAHDFDQLFDQVKAIAWEEWLTVDAKFPVTARCVRSDIRSVPNTQKMVKRAIVDRLRQVYLRHWFAETGTEYCIDAHILADRVLITLDTTGDGLHKRGYRNLVGRAPLRETVAAAMVKLSYWNRDRLLVDPFCGSGTIPIEAAMIGRNIAPGRTRSFVSENWEQIPRSIWTAARQETKDLEIRKPLRIPIIATDRDRFAIKMAVQHARQAGVESDVHFAVRDFIAFPTNRDEGILICNPPYGERLGDEAEVRQLYRDMGELLRPLDDWSLYILTGAEGFEREFGKQADRRRKLYNARIACTFYQYLGPKPSGTAEMDDDSDSDAGAVPAVDADTDRVTATVPDADAHSAQRVDHGQIDAGAESTGIPASAAGEFSATPKSAAADPLPEESPAAVPDNPWTRARLQQRVREAMSSASTGSRGRKDESQLVPLEKSASSGLESSEKGSESQPVNPWQKRPVSAEASPPEPAVNQGSEEAIEPPSPDDQPTHAEDAISGQNSSSETSLPAGSSGDPAKQTDQIEPESQKPEKSKHPWKKNPWPR